MRTPIPKAEHGSQGTRTYIMYNIYWQRVLCGCNDILPFNSFPFQARAAQIRAHNVCISHERKVASSTQEIAGVVSLLHL
jgi:hypothetical protein